MTNSDIRTCYLGFLSVLLSLLIYKVIVALDRAQTDFDSVTADIHSLVLPAQKAEASIAAASLTLAQVGAEERKAFVEQDAYYRMISANTTALLESANDTIQHFNSDVLPRVDSNLDSSRQLLDDSRNELSDLAVSGRETIEASQSTLAALTRDEDDIQPILRNTAEITAHAAATSAHLEAASADIAQFVHRETTPVRGTWNVIKAFLREFAGPAAQVATAAK